MQIETEDIVISWSKHRLTLRILQGYFPSWAFWTLDGKTLRVVHSVPN